MKTYCQQELYIETLRAELAAAKQQLDMPHGANAMLCECERELAAANEEVWRLRDEIARVRDELAAQQEAGK